jgi:hypothetical protein
VDVGATVDYWDDQDDVYRVHLRRRQVITARLLAGPAATRLSLWRPGTTRVNTSVPALERRRLARSRTDGAGQLLRYRARSAGWYFVQVRAEEPGFGRYSLRVTRP